MARAAIATVTALAACLVGAGATGSADLRSAVAAESTAAAAVTTDDAVDAWRPNMRAARRYAKRRAGSVRFAVVDSVGGMHDHRGARTAPAASVLKAMLLATYLRDRDVRDRRLRRSDRRLLGPMIRRSDNETATRVRDIVGRRAIVRLARRAGMRRFRYDRVWGLSRINAVEQARFFHRYERYLPARHEGYARRLLSTIVASQRWGIARVTPEGWQLFFKGGWGSGSGRVDHQVAWLERGGDRIAVAILTEYNPSHRYGKRTLRGVSERLLRGLPE